MDDLVLWTKGVIPYRAAAAAEVVEAQTVDGVARLEIAPQHTALDVGDKVRCTFTRSAITVLKSGRKNKVKKREIPLDDRPLVVARAHETRDVAIWCEQRPGIFERIVGLKPPVLLDDDAIAAWRRLDRLAGRLQWALVSRSSDDTQAWEFGKGQHRVLLSKRGDMLTIYARPIFRERPRKVIDVRSDCSITLYSRKGAVTVKCRPSRYDIIAIGDRIRFTGAGDEDVATLYLPWISPQDRQEIARRFGALVESGATE